jgi:hypothetical protein
VCALESGEERNGEEFLGVHGDKNGADLWSVSSDVAKIVKMPCQHGLLLFATCMVVLAKLFLSLAKLLLFPSFLKDFFAEKKVTERVSTGFKFRKRNLLREHLID